MSATKSLGKIDIFWGYLAQALNIGTGIILLPAILRYMPAHEVGLWFIFMTLSSLAQLLEIGFQPTLARNAAYVYSGAKKLTKYGLQIQNSSNCIDEILLRNLIAASKKIYKKIGIAIALALYIGGSIYITNISSTKSNIDDILYAWIAFSSGTAINFYYGNFNGLLQGRGEVTKASKLIAISRGLLIIIGSTAVILGYGLIGLGVSSLIAAAFGRWAAHKYFYDKKTKELLNQHKADQIKINEITSVIWHNASRFGLVQLGAFLVVRGNILVASSYLGLEESASYGLTITLLAALSSVSMVICQLQMPQMNVLQSQKNKDKLIALFGEINIIGWTIYLIGFAILMLYGKEILTLINSKTLLVEKELLAIIGIIFLLELNHSISATYLTTKNTIPFLSSSLISGAGVLITSMVFVKPFGLWGLALSQGIIQALYNNWKWPNLAKKSLNANIVTIIKEGSKEIINKYLSKK